MRPLSADEPAAVGPALKFTLWLLVIAAAAIAVHGTRPPAALDASAPSDQFSAARAKMHLGEIAREPHSIGTAANQRVRDYLVQQLAALGADVRVEKTVGITSYSRMVSAGTAENIVATVKGTSNSRAVMLASHYDSVPESPGAADAGSGVSAILEVLRALKAGPPLQNDLVVLLSDGEEEGLVGAAGFVRDNPDLAQKIGLVLNFEARGSSGPALMFETSDGNGWLTREFARAAPYPLGSSLAYAVYKQMPNNTDMTVFKRAGLNGINFAFSGTFENYHTRRDTAENLDLRSLQHLGSNALALTRHFGNLSLGHERAPNRIFFNWYGSFLVHYPPWGVWAVLALAVALLVALLISLSRRGLISPVRALAGFGGFLLVLIAALGAAQLVWWLMRLATTGRLLVGDTLSNLLIALSCVAAALALAIAVHALLVAKLGRHNFIAGQLLFFATATAALTVLSPEASYVLQWPLVFGLLGFGASLVLRNGNGAAAALFLGALPAILIFAPLMYLLFVVLGMDAISVAVLAVLLCFFATVASPLLVMIARPLRIVVPVLVLCALALAAAGRQLSRFSPEHPRRNSIFYSVNVDEPRAAWLSYDNAPDQWTEQFLTNSRNRGANPELTVGSSRPVLAHPAELIPVAPPTAAVISDAVVNGARNLKLHIASPRNADMLLMRLPGDVNLLSVTINNREHTIEGGADASGPWLLRYNAIPPEGVDIELRLASAGSLRFWLGDRSLGLPEISGQSYRPRPDDMMATYGSDVILIGRKYTF